MGWTASQRGVLAVGALIFCSILLWRWTSQNRYIPDPPPAQPQRELVDRIDPNTADWPALAALPAIGEVRARGIVAWREQYQREHPGQLAFTRLEDLDQVKGIGPATLETLEPYLQFPSGPTTRPAAGPAKP